MNNTKLRKSEFYMSEDTRIKYSDAQNVALVTQVESVCPLCADPLFIKKGKKSYKAYEIAHIYPLNPTAAEVELLKNEERLGEVNDEENVIPLCKTCHGKLDNPRTIKEYRELLEIKKGLIARSGQEAIWKIYTIESDISEIVDLIYSNDDIVSDVEINFNPKDIANKTNDTISRPTVRKIKNNVSGYYILIRNKMSMIDKSSLNFSDIVSTQIRGFYLKQKQLGLDQQEIFDNIVKWIMVKTKPKTIEAAEIIASFFVQNCEIFE